MNTTKFTSQNPVWKQVDNAPAIKASPINPEWANEVAEAYGLSGPLSKAVAESISELVGKQIAEVISHEKLLGLIKKVINKKLEEVFKSRPVSDDNERDVLKDLDNDD